MEAILDFSQPFNPSLLDQIISVFYNPQNPEVWYLLFVFIFVATKSESSALRS